MKLRKYITEGGVNETDLKSSINKVLLDVNEIVSDPLNMWSNESLSNVSQLNWYSCDDPSVNTIM